MNKLFSIPSENFDGKADIKEKENIIGLTEAILENVRTGKKRIIYGKNIITDEGDKYYAQRGAAETPTNDYTSGGCKLGTGTTTPTKGDTDIETDLGSSYKGVFSGYPKSNDGESANGGVDIATYKFVWGTSEANANNIKEAAICSDNGAPPSGCLCHLHFTTAFDKTSEETLTLFIHHEMNGV